MIKENLEKQEVEIVLYQPEENVQIEVQLHDETVWLSQQQMAQLFSVKVPAISKHIKNIYEEVELQRDPTISILETVRLEGNRTVVRNVEFYNLDVIISVGYRIKSIAGTHFRQWANKILKQYLLRGFAVNQQMLQLEERISNRIEHQLKENEQRFLSIENTQAQQQQQLDFFIRTSTPPAEMVFFNGDFFTARVAIEQLIKSALRRAIIIDGYIDAKTFDILGCRSKGVLGEIYTAGVGDGIKRLRDEYNRQSDVEPINVFKWKKVSHDRWLIIDDRLYHCGHSLNAVGNKMSAISLMGKSPEEILDEVR